MDLTKLPHSAVERFRHDLHSTLGFLPHRLGLAVSGGPDSLALLALAQGAMPGRIEVATVDHGLRPEAAAEAGFVGALCAELQVPHETLRPAEPLVGNIQSSARAARYALLESWRGASALDRIATAHHSDDQAETLMMRLNRGSGVSGLAGVRAVNGMLVRPLLGWRRSELEELVKTVCVTAVEDPSNQDERYDRVRLRRHLAAAPWIDQAALARSAMALGQAEEALDWAISSLWTERAKTRGDCIALDPGGLPSELRRRLVARALEALNPRARPRGDELGLFISRLESGVTATLAGVKGFGGVVWRLELAPPRRTAG